MVYELGASSSHINDPTLKNCLFGAVTLTKNADIGKYEEEVFHFQVSGYGQNNNFLSRYEFFCLY